MDSNDNNQSDPVQHSESSILKTEAVKVEPEDNEISDQSSYNNIKDSNTDENSNDYPSNGQKRKSSENSPQEEDRMNDDTSVLPSNSVKRRRYTDIQIDNSAHDSSLEERQKFTLIVSNASGDWTSEQVLDYIRDTEVDIDPLLQCGVHISKVNDSREGNTETDYQIKLKFVSKDQLNKVREKLKGKEVEGKLITEVENEMVEQPPDTKDERESDAESNATVGIGEREPQTTEGPMRQNQEYETDSGDFHIKEDYLQSLGISLPISNWVNVTNFRCDKSELKEVLELAGKVLICSVVTTVHKYANAMYSHPLEAVQAVSMLNGQTFYGKKLKVIINNSSHVKTLLPKGLVSVGPGLGKFGKAVQDLSDQYKRFIRGQNSAIDASLFQQDLLDRIGVTVERDVSYTRSLETPYSQTSQNDVCVRNSADSSESVSQISHMDENQFGPIGQKPPGFHNTPVSDYTAQSVSVNINSNGQNVSMNRTTILNVSRDPRVHQRYLNCPPISGNDAADRLIISSAIITGPHPVAGQIGASGSVTGSGHVSGSLSMAGPGSGTMTYPGQMSNSGPMSGPRSISGPSAMSGSGHMSAPVPMSGLGPMSGSGSMSVPGPMPGPGPMSGHSRMPGPGHLTSGPMSGPGHISGVCPRPMSARASHSVPGPKGPGPNQMVHMSTGPRGPMPMNRFPGPASPMLGPRPMVPSGQTPNQIRPNGPRPIQGGTNVHMFRADPVTLQMSNLPPNTNFLNLGHKLSELGHVVYLEFTTPGCAVVRFANPSDAERCFQNYRKVLG